MDGEMDKSQFLCDLDDAGISFIISTPSQNGVDTCVLPPSKVLKFMTQPEAVYADLHGITLRDYLQWEAEGMSVQCSARTKAGKRCKNVVAGGASVNPKIWVDLHGQYCEVHNGMEGKADIQR